MKNALLGVYAVKHKDINIRMKSRSGGIFTAISDIILESSGVVYGCTLTDDLKIIHTRANTKADRDKMRGSKYVQSDLGNMYKSVKEDLENDLYVLFSGTSCQIAGLKAYLYKEYDKLLCVDIVCHGVPSPLVWKEYIVWQENKNKAKCISVDFRNKQKFGWASHVETLEMKRNKKRFYLDSNVFTTLFYDHNILRPACYKCPYKSTIHPGDITIADYWGIDKAAPNFNDNKGVSLVLINNLKGKYYFDNCKSNIDDVECDIKNSMQEPLIKPFNEPINRSLFWDEYYKNSFNKIAIKYCKQSILERLKNLIKKILRKILRKIKNLKK